MNREIENERETLNETTRQKLKNLSQALLRLHKTLLDGAKAQYEIENGAIANANQYLQLVLDDVHFAWLRKISSLVALLDEAVSPRRAASQTAAESLLNEARRLLNFENTDADFNDKFHAALQKNHDAVLSHNDALKFTN